MQERNNPYHNDAKVEAEPKNEKKRNKDVIIVTSTSKRMYANQLLAILCNSNLPRFDSLKVTLKQYIKHERQCLIPLPNTKNRVLNVLDELRYVW